MAEAEKKGIVGVHCGGKTDWFSLDSMEMKRNGQLRLWRTVLGLLRRESMEEGREGARLVFPDK